MSTWEPWVGKQVRLKTTSQYYNQARGQVGTVQATFGQDRVVVEWQSIPNTAYLYIPHIDIYLAENKITDIKCIPKQTIIKKG